MITLKIPKDGEEFRHHCIYGSVTDKDPFTGGILILPEDLPEAEGDCDYPELHTEEFTDALLAAMMRAIEQRDG